MDFQCLPLSIGVLHLRQMSHRVLFSKPNADQSVYHVNYRGAKRLAMTYKYIILKHMPSNIKASWAADKKTIHYSPLHLPRPLTRLEGSVYHLIEEAIHEKTRAETAPKGGGRGTG